MINFRGKHDKIPGYDVRDLKLFKTPGHTVDSISAETSFQGKKFILSGDALKKRLIENGIINKSYDLPQLYLENMIKILDMADIVIGGEDGLINEEEVIRLRKLVRKVKIEQ